MNLRQYEYALVVAEEGSVTAAAARLGVAQPTVSQQLATLEKDLGVRIFTRIPRGVAATVAGRAFLKEAEIAVNAARRARVVARASGGDLTGELVVVASTGLATNQLAAALGELRRIHPRLQVTLVEEPTPVEMEHLDHLGTVDLVLYHRLTPECGYDPYELGEEPYAAVLPAHHPLHQADSVRLEDLAGEAWVRFTRGSLLDGQLGQVLKDAGLTPATVARASQISTAVRLVAHGLGVTMIPASAVPTPYTHLAKPLTPALSERVLAGLRRDPGPAETALLDLLRQQDWSTPATFSTATPHLAASG
ncbi:LysR family transcriptional regulator [Streptomyces sp. 11x1]|uniref:LysR family transcriptional regulator n=1 Tax=Streptomyces sp. 11x1 TaxID=3038642 RepID=UPI00292DE425|nr:LysR family transcriptional regulator [Streptomyces sp. 11x1]WNZ12910.1 LysR family transcriptional regulator [Streptomyces sp. 11x1]